MRKKEPVDQIIAYDLEAAEAAGELVDGLLEAIREDKERNDSRWRWWPFRKKWCLYKCKKGSSRPVRRYIKQLNKWYRGEYGTWDEFYEREIKDKYEQGLQNLITCGDFAGGTSVKTQPSDDANFQHPLRDIIWSEPDADKEELQQDTL